MRRILVKIRLQFTLKWFYFLAYPFNILIVRDISMNIELALNQVSYYETNEFPHEAVEYISSNKNLFEDRLIEILDRYSKNTDLYKELKDDFVSALLLLAQFQSKKAFPIIIHLLKTLPYSEKEDQPLGDLITETIPSILAACFDGNLEKTLELIYSADSYIFAKVAVLGMLEILLCADRLTEEEILTYYDQLAKKLHKSPDQEEFLQYALECVAEISLEKVDAICSKYNITLDEDTQLEIDYLKRENVIKPYYLLNKSKTLKVYTEIIEGGIKILEGWSKFTPKEKPLFEPHSNSQDLYLNQPPLPKMYELGRNEPCYCGSGKKFKKCCL